MKKAFTMLELVFVIVVVGIISAMIAPNFQGNNLRKAADQLISHIRYTQHLAMMDDKFDNNDSTWFKKRWQIRFSKTNGSDRKWSYTIYSETAVGGPDGVPNKSEMARNPLNPNQRLTGGYSAGTIQYSDDDASKELNLGHKYGITDIIIDPASGCYIDATNGKRLISFGALGRPLYGNANSLDSIYADGTNSRLIQSQCRIILSDTDSNITIAIEPETGYAHIL